jgi:hypothetical protein
VTDRKVTAKLFVQLITFTTKMGVINLELNTWDGMGMTFIKLLSSSLID